MTNKTAGLPAGREPLPSRHPPAPDARRNIFLILVGDDPPKTGDGTLAFTRCRPTWWWGATATPGA